MGWRERGKPNGYASLGCYWHGGASAYRWWVIGARRRKIGRLFKSFDREFSRPSRWPKVARSDDLDWYFRHPRSRHRSWKKHRAAQYRQKRVG